MKINFSGVYRKIDDLDCGDTFVNDFGSICMKVPLVMINGKSKNVYNLISNNFEFYSYDAEVLVINTELKIK